MAPKPSLSITLPRNFQFHYADADTPQTPAPPSEEEITEPPPPPKQTFKVRRRRADNVARDLHSDNDSTAGALPTFEMTEAADESPEARSAMSPRYLAPRSSILPLLSPPRTPISQTNSYDDKDDEWSMISNSQYLITRPLSACSSFSNSSASSCGSSIQSYPSLAGSCTSPESEPTDPFQFPDHKIWQPVFSPDLYTETPVAKRPKTTRHTRWTAEMDNHLWLTYMIYIQDPRVTPFKMLPGTAPPLGVCHRVARESKHSWKGHRASSLSETVIPRISLPRECSPDTIRPANSNGSSTPIASEYNRAPPKWPRSEAATRKRLRELCKRKPSLSAHYQRLLQTRSPSPFQSSSPRSRSDPESSAFSSRELNVSLAAATAPSMQAEGPMAQLTSDVPPQQIEQPTQPERPEGWFKRIGRSQAHQKSQSLQLGLGLGHGYGSEVTRPGPLASPFDGGFDRGHILHSMNATHSLGRNFTRKPESETILKSPLELHAPVPTSRSLKRRFKLDEEVTPARNSVKDLFADPAPRETPVWRPTRDRAFSLGAVHDGTRSLSSVFSRPLDAFASDITMTDASGSSDGHLQAPEPARRLGSPFGGASSGTHFNTFPRRFTPMGAAVPGQSLEDRFRELAGQSRRQQ